MSKSTWQGKERLVGRWFGVNRNPLSGRNNVADDGTRRLGDIIHPKAMVEVKCRKDVSMEVAMSTRLLARTQFKPWLVAEFKVARSGSAPEADLVKFTMDHRTAQAVCEFLNQYWETL